MPTNNRSERIWLRLIQAYGSRVAESYGEDMPQIWIDAMEHLTDTQIDYGMRKVVRDTPVHPPTLGQFSQACADTPQQKTKGLRTIQEQLTDFVVRTHFPTHRDSKFTPDQARQSSLPWTYLYHDWIDDSRPKHSQACAECTGVLVPAAGALPGFKVTVSDMISSRMQLSDKDAP